MVIWLKWIYIYTVYRHEYIHVDIFTEIPANIPAHLQVGGVGVKDYSGRPPSREQIGDVVCKSDPKPGFSFVLDNFAELLDDTFLQNLTSTICQGTTHKYRHTHTHTSLVISLKGIFCINKLTSCVLTSR